MSPIGQHELWVVVQAGHGPGPSCGPMPALAFKKLFDAMLAALIAADREIHTKLAASEFLIDCSASAYCEFGLVERLKANGTGASSAVELFRRCAGRVYRSDYQILLRYPRLMRAFQRIVAALDPRYPVVVRYHDGELPLDDFFRRQVDRVGLPNDVRPMTDMWFAGRDVASFDGRLESIDYRGSLWRGRLTLAGGETQIECVFDRAMGEDALNPFGNKDVSVTGRAIFTGDSQLPERVEVLSIEEMPRASAAVDIRRCLAPTMIEGWADEFDHLHKR